MNAKLSPVPLSFHVESDTLTELAAFLETQARRHSARILLAEKSSEHHHPIGEWQLEEMLDARSLAGIIHGAALREAQVLRESIVYGVFAFHADSPVVVGRFVFRIDVGNGFAPSRKADEQGILGMLMSHAEVSARLSLGHSREIVDQYQTLFVQQNVHASRQLEQAHARIRALEEREALAIETHERLQSQLLERQASLEAAKRNDDRRDEMRRFGLEKLGLLLPLLMAKLGAPGGAAAGGAGVAAPAATNPTDELIDTLIRTMSGEQAKAIANLLTQEQVVLFIHVYEASLGRIAQKNQAAAEARARGASSVDPGATPPPDPNPPPVSKDPAS
jgi:hypothetical protein